MVMPNKVGMDLHFAGIAGAPRVPHHKPSPVKQGSYVNPITYV